jgi:gliding motility-associated-like protein
MPTVQLTGSGEICMGQTAQLNAEITSDPSGVSYHWINDPTLSCTDCFNPIVNPLDTTTYYFVINNLIGCTDTFSITVIVRPYPAPVLTITPDTTICKDDVLQLNVNGGPDIYTYDWNASSQSLSCDNCPNPVASPTELTTYHVTVTNQWDCSTEGEVVVDILDEYQPFAGEDKTICEGDDTQLDASFGNNPIWLVANGLDCTNCPDPVSSPNITTEYLVEVTTDYGCRIVDTVVVNIVHPEDVDAGLNDLICDGESVQLIGFAEGDISWSPSFDLNNSTILNPIGRPSSSVTYYMTATNGDCVLTDSVFIEVIDKAEIFVDDVTICEGEGIQLVAYGIADSYSWYESPDLSDLFIPNPIAMTDETETYTVIGQMGMCEADTARVTVNVIPELDAFIPQYYQYFDGQTVQLNLSIDNENNYFYQWYPTELLDCTNCTDPSLTPDTTMTYSVEITDPTTGCITTKSTIVKEYFSCPPELIGVPNIFTPNHDGINDILKMELSPSMSEIFTFKIFNRWGALVFETNDHNVGWDGTYRGETLPTGVYIYFIEAPCEVNNRRMIKKGDITIIR